MTIAAILPALTEDGAERLSGRISARLDGIADNYVAVMPLIREALNRNAYAVLGYASHGAYIKDRFGDALGKLGIELRREIVRELSSAGLSTRAIAPVVGVSNFTVSKDIAAVSDLTPAPEPADEPLPPANPFTGEVIDEPAVVTETHTVKVVTGLDGKEYTRPSAPSEPRRRSLVDDAFTANTRLWEAIERIRSIRNDDRYARNKADILAALQPSADLALEVLNDLFEPQKEN